MLEEIINSPALEEYLSHFKEGETLCSEGDECQDLYILVSGRLEILKGDKRISEIAEQGASFGEISFLLGGRRTATVRARTEGQTVRIPRDRIEAFLEKFPTVALQILKILAERLQETTSAFYGFKEFSDKLPDAVLVSDSGGRIVSWNHSAEKVFGKSWDQMKETPIQELLEESKDYQDLLGELRSTYPESTDKVVKVKHPVLGIRYISTSNTVLYDGNYNLEGVLSLGRDVTRLQNMQRKYKRILFWLVPICVFLALLAGAAFFIYPQFSEKKEVAGIKRQSLRDQIAKDYLLLKSLLAEPLAADDLAKTSQVLNEFFEIQKENLPPYRGIVILGEAKRVYNAFRPGAEGAGKGLIGSSYAGIPFQDAGDSVHKVLRLYRAEKGSPMGAKGLEIAFEMRMGGNTLGWLLFQMDVKRLEDEYNVTEETIRELRFSEP